MKELTIVKIGGQVIDQEELLDHFLNDFSRIEGLKILVHGGGKIASEVGNRLGHTPKMIDGRRITDKESLEVVTMVYGGLTNKKIVSKLQAMNVNAMGVTGADGNLMKATVRPKEPLDFGFVGDVEPSDVDSTLVQSFMGLGLVLVIPALTHDGEGSMLNTNADTMASTIAQALIKYFKVKLLYCFEEEGVYSDFQSRTLIDVLNEETFKEYQDAGKIFQGMIPKLHNAFEAKHFGVDAVRIGSFQNLKDLQDKNLNGTDIL